MSLPIRLKSVYAYTPEGFMIEVQPEIDENGHEAITAHEIVAALLKANYQPINDPTAKETNQPAAGTRKTLAVYVDSEENHICVGHGKIMSRREKQGDVWYSHEYTDETTGEVIYCRGLLGEIIV